MIGTHVRNLSLCDSVGNSNIVKPMLPGIRWSISSSLALALSAKDLMHALRSEPVIISPYAIIFACGSHNTDTDTIKTRELSRQRSCNWVSSFKTEWSIQSWMKLWICADEGETGKTRNRRGKMVDVETREKRSGIDEERGERSDDPSFEEGINQMPKCSFGNLTVIMTRAIENTFYRWDRRSDFCHPLSVGNKHFPSRLGHLIGKHPWMTILLSLLLCVACSCGMIMWYQVTDDELLWTPYGSPVRERQIFLQDPNSGAVFALQFREDKKWIENNFPKDMRYESVILSGDNVLQPEYFQYVSQFYSYYTV